MDACRSLMITLALVALPNTAPTQAATYRTDNFVVDAPTPEIARKVGDLAEHYRDELAVEWLGEKLPKWYKPCQVRVKVGQLGAGGATTFAFDRGEVFGWNMTIQGTLERILDSVLPHEISHTILACKFRCPLPRWADEGAATLVEHESEQRRQRMLLNDVMRSSRRIPLRKLFAITEYPEDMQDVLTLYAEGYSVADFLVQRGGKARYLRFLEQALQDDWDSALQAHYGYQNIERFEKQWSNWVIAGSPKLLPEGQQFAANERNPQRPSNVVIRAQTPDEEFTQPRPSRPRNVRPTSPQSSQAEVASESGWTPVDPDRRTPTARLASRPNEDRPRGRIDLGNGSDSPF